MHSLAGSSFDSHVILTFRPQCLASLMRRMSTKFGVDISSRFPIRRWTQTDRQAQRLYFLREVTSLTDFALATETVADCHQRDEIQRFHRVGGVNGS